MSIFCEKCGKPISESATFCKYCGYKQGSGLPVNNPVNDVDNMFSQEGATTTTETDKGLSKQVIALIVGAAIVVVATVVVGMVMFLGDSDEALPETNEVVSENQIDNNVKPNSSNTATPNVVSPEELVIVDYDINFSQVENFDLQPVDVLFKITNNSVAPVKTITYTIRQGERCIKNRETGEDAFTAYGYIKPNETGYLYSQISIPASTPSDQGSITIKDVEECEDLGGYTMPSGEINGYHSKTDSYDVTIYNPGDNTVKAGRATVIAVRKNKKKLSDAWGCGSVSKDIEPGEKADLKNVIHDPGFSNYKSGMYDAFVIDKDVIGLD